MKKIKRWLNDIFGVEEFNNLDTSSIGEAFNDLMVRTIWLNSCFDELKRLNLEVDKRLLTGQDFNLIDLCARRKAYQDVLEAILSARRQVINGQQVVRPNPKVMDVNLDRVTA
jgi:hypothetical protein